VIRVAMGYHDVAQILLSPPYVGDSGEDVPSPSWKACIYKHQLAPFIDDVSMSIT